MAGSTSFVDGSALNPRRRSWAAGALVAGMCVSLSGCFRPRLTLEEVQAAIDAVVVMGQARQAVDDVVEISTSFTIGDGVEAYVEQVRLFLESQAPCTTVEASPGELVVDFGGLADACSYRGRTYGGQVVYSFEVQGDDVIVTHDYRAFTNGDVTLDGAAEVTWGGQARRVETDFTIVGDRATIDTQADRTMVWIDESLGLAGGIRIDGTQDWQGPLGDWTMSIDGVEVRAQDPVPQSGRFELVTPRDVLATLSFSRLDDDTIEMVFEGPRNRRAYHVTSLGQVEDVTDG